MEPVFCLIPQRRGFQCFFHGLREDLLVSDAVYFQRIGDVVRYGHGKGVWLLEDHPHGLPQCYDVYTGTVDVDTFDEYLSGNFQAVDQVVHPVDCSQQSGLATPGRSDKSGNQPFFH